MVDAKITMADLDGLPDDLIKQLKISPSFEFSWQIIKCIKDNDGKISIDKLLVSYYHAHNEVLNRQKTNAKLYRMVQQGLISAVAGVKGVYELNEKSEEGVANE